MNRSEIQGRVAGVCEGWAANASRLESVRARVSDLAVAIRDAKAHVSSLFADKRAAPRHEKASYQSSIEMALDAKAALLDDLRSSKQELAGCQSERTALNQSRRSIDSEVRRELARLTGGLRRLTGEVPGWAGNEAVALHQSVSSGRSFCEEQLRALSATFGSGESATDEVEFVSEPPHWAVLGPTPDAESPLHLFGPPVREAYATVDGSRTVPYESYSLFDTLSVDGLSVEEKSLMYAEAFLQSRGHRAVMSIGGPGLPDIISLDRDGRLWISEIKGTDVSRLLPATGLERTLSGEGQESQTLFENSSAWLLRQTAAFNRVDQVLTAANRAYEGENDAGKKEEFRLLRESYRAAAREGFNALSCDKQLVQVGFQGDGDNLRPPSAMRSQVLDRYIGDVEPAMIVQVEVVSGAAESPVFERPPDGAVDADASKQASVESQSDDADDRDDAT